MSKPKTSDNHTIPVEGIPIVISGPAGVGKTVVTRTLTSRTPEINYSVSATSRDQRPGEVEGRDYYFLSTEEFERKLKAGEFLEYTQRLDKYYGTLRGPLVKKLKAGHDVVLDLDFRGAVAMRKEFPRGLFIYLLPPSQQLLVERLEGRKRDPQSEIERRLKLDMAEARHMLQYDYFVVNWEVDETVNTVRTIIEADRFRRDRCLRTLIHLGCIPKELEPLLREMKGLFPD